MKRLIRFFPSLLALSFLAPLAAIQCAGVTLQDLLNAPSLTPEAFAQHFADFQFELREKVQSPEVFLANKRGDCDDFAVLASDVLKLKGYTPRLVVVFMPKDIHVVCYIEETKSFLDFNRRNLSAPTVPSDGSLPDIADKVAKSFRSKWHCVSEFTFKNGARQFVFTDFPQEKAGDPSTEESKVAAKPLVSQLP